MKRTKVSKKGVIVDVGINGKTRRLKRPIHVKAGDLIEVDGVTGVVYHNGTPYFTEPEEGEGIRKETD